jgi:hypothetical protein
MEARKPDEQKRGAQKTVFETMSARENGRGRHLSS